MAGILDNYQFDPQSYGGLPGWLGQLLSSQPGQSQGFQDQIPPQAAPTMGQRGPGVNLPTPNAGEDYGKTPETQNPLMGLLSSLMPSGTAQAGQAQAQQAPQTPQGPGIMDRLTAGATNFTTGGNPLAGIMNAIGGLSTGQRTDRTGLALQQQAATMRALVQAGVDPATAQAAALNPEILKTIAAAHFDTAPKLQETGTDPLTGQKSFGLYRPAQGTLTPVGGGPGGAMAGSAPGIEQVFNQIESARNAGAPQEKLLQAVPTSLRDGVAAMIEGRAIPTNLSNRGAARDLALRFAHQIDPTFDETLVGARALMRKDLAKTTPGSAGGQITFAGTSINHLADVAKAAEALDNSNGFGIAPLGHLINDVRGLTTSQAAKVAELNGATQHYGQEVTKFYAGSPGGEGERQRFLTSIGQSKTKEELVGALQAERDLIPGRISELRNRIQSTLGPAAEQFTKQLDQAERSLPEIDATIARMKGQGQKQPASQISEGATATNPKTGQRLMFKGGQWQPIQ